MRHSLHNVHVVCLGTLMVPKVKLVEIIGILCEEVPVCAAGRLIYADI
jgi:hypothetical protein